MLALKAETQGAGSNGLNRPIAPIDWGHSASYAIALCSDWGDMLNWSEFSEASPKIASAGVRLMSKHEVAFLATVSDAGRPRIHPFVPKIVGAKLVAFIMDSSPKQRDLRVRKQYAIHLLPGKEDEEFNISGTAELNNDDPELRESAAKAMGFATGVDEHHLLYEFRLDRALWTTWLDFGTPDHRPNYTRWKAD